ncbi:hypothetical protein NW762_003597 [Fusarium torreyae]|uniref:Uncharacterized protein n=1 Tax=Fusarium torreyae TaxID=1237075 RepID=A0A9W8S929_9HYPO|nr:hypothetical protein NW762_003597 [Fusarium torreyae]
MGMSELAHKAGGSDSLDDWLEGIELPSPASWITFVVSSMPHLRVDIDWSQVFVHNLVDHDWKLHPEAMRRIASNVRNHLQKTGLASLVVWFFPEDTIDRHWRDILGNVNIFTSPYNDYLVNVRTGHADLTFNNIGKIDPEDKPDRSIDRIARDVVWRFYLVEQKPTDVRGSIEKQVEAARSRDDHNKAEQLEKTIGEKSRNAFVETAAEILYGMIKVLSVQAVADLPSEPPSVQCTSHPPSKHLRLSFDTPQTRRTMSAGRQDPQLLGWSVHSWPQTQQGLARGAILAAMRKLHRQKEDDVTEGM